VSTVAAELAPDALARWWRQHVHDFDGPLQLTALTGGQSNPTYGVEAGSHRWALRRKPPGVRARRMAEAAWRQAQRQARQHA
jgi:aminoglycoside phosphotransferase (APT) family kinase protein